MGLRQWINDHHRAATGVMLAVALIAIAGVMMQLSGSPAAATSARAYFYDVSAGELFIDDAAAIPPIRDGAGVKAAVFSCGDCGDADARFVAWLESYTEQARAALAAQQPTSGDPAQAAAVTISPVIQRGHLIAAVPTEGASPQWAPMAGAQAAQIQSTLTERCGSRPVRACSP